jgi:hypothetical protein
MREAAREEARRRAGALSPAALRRQRRRLLYAARRQAPVAMLSNPSSAQRLQNSGAPTEGAEGVHAFAQTRSESVEHHVAVMGDGPPVGSQEPREVCNPRIEVLVTNVGDGATQRGRHLRRGCGGRIPEDRTTTIPMNPAGNDDIVASGRARGRGAGIRQGRVGGRIRGQGGREPPRGNFE